MILLALFAILVAIAAAVVLWIVVIMAGVTS